MIESWSERIWICPFLKGNEKWFELKRWDDPDSEWSGKVEKVKSEFSDTEHIDELSGKTGFFNHFVWNLTDRQYRICQQVLFGKLILKISKPREIRIWFFCQKKFRQIEGRSAVLCYNVNKLSRFFSSFWNF